MDKKDRKDNIEEPRKQITQFIIECMFSKYFEEEKDDEVVVKREKVAA